MTFSHPAYDAHEQVLFCHDRETGLRAIIAVHNRNLGPALGGCRMYPYASDEAALRDVLRLSRGMSYKAAVTGLPLGGGKSVILGDPATQKSPALMRAMGRFVDSLGGRYIAAEDSGTSVADVQAMAGETAHVSGVRERDTDDGRPRDGDPSPYTARGVFAGIRAAVAHRHGGDSLDGVTVALQGLGNVGRSLAAMLHEAGARLVVSDPSEARLAEARERFGAEVVALDAIVGARADVFAPCAMGAVLDDASIPTLQASIVAGAANNQLESAHHAAALAARDVLYAPDYVINAGGLIDVYHELYPVPYAEEMARIDAIGTTLTTIFARADAEQATTAAIADRLAEERMALPAA